MNDEKCEPKPRRASSKTRIITGAIPVFTVSLGRLRKALASCCQDLFLLRPFLQHDLISGTLTLTPPDLTTCLFLPSTGPCCCRFPTFPHRKDQSRVPACCFIPVIQAKPCQLGPFQQHPSTLSSSKCCGFSGSRLSCEIELRRQHERTPNDIKHIDFFFRTSVTTCFKEEGR